MCVFCKIVNKEIPAKVVYEDDLIMAFHDINPQRKVHVLVIPKKHIPSVNDITPEDKKILGHLWVKIPEIVKILGIDRDGYRIIVNTGKDGGQEIYHIHYHILGGQPVGPMVCK
ncbi:MAG TPA: histidine triad nucleotide-binding protein [Aquifex aeolicus]|uniref:Histidine triad nucleotide-binding protein n=1 Tax=Aquifex aeolicus TaxID=63363 RepID=A0A9D0YRJ4_AQUAO|nr:histidine triad nucleotide-binding protein [Aquificales bacterium]HIP98915.1 histidine triad nucleotide-binding protein [Aquifex aeolicus]HIQ26806.1 histidine triad nucleotide-binding protein [Aquifex aeolicus]